MMASQLKSEFSLKCRMYVCEKPTLFRLYVSMYVKYIVSQFTL